MDNVKDNLVFSMDAWPEAGIDCEFTLSPSVFLAYLTPEDEPNFEVPNLLTSVRGNLALVKLSGGRLKVTGAFAVKAEMNCARCLSTFVGKVGDNFEEIVDLGEPSSEATLEERECFVPIRNGAIDLSPLLAELFWLSWPIKAVCKPDCRGLCPGCGANLNDGPCLCAETKVTRH
jgi:uncharacterized metal-binding protein YceD (DUF177 family)